MLDALLAGCGPMRAREALGLEIGKHIRTTTAMGPSISRPGSPLPMASGRQAGAVTNAVIKIGANRSEAPRIAVSRFQVVPSTCTKMLVMRNSMMEFRSLIRRV